MKFNLLSAMADGVRGHADRVPSHLHDPRLAPRPHGGHLGVEGVPAARGVLLPRGGHPGRRLRGAVRAAQAGRGALQDTGQPQEHAGETATGNAFDLQIMKQGGSLNHTIMLLNR